LTTLVTRSDGTPHPVRPRAVLLEDRLYSSTNPENPDRTQSQGEPGRRRPPGEHAAEAVIVLGLVDSPGPRSPGTVVAAYESKYGWRLDPEDPGMPFFELAPRRVLAWRAQRRPA
jgi:hypothetical protein